MQKETKDWLQLEDHVKFLLDEGKRSGHEDFQTLFRVFGREKIIVIATRYLEEKKKNETRARD